MTETSFGSFSDQDPAAFSGGRDPLGRLTHGKPFVDTRPIVPETGEPMDPSMDPDLSLDDYPQDPEGRRPDETPDDWHGRTGRIWKDPLPRTGP